MPEKKADTQDKALFLTNGAMEFLWSLLASIPFKDEAELDGVVPILESMREPLDLYRADVQALRSKYEVQKVTPGKGGSMKNATREMVIPDEHQDEWHENYERMTFSDMAAIRIPEISAAFIREFVKELPKRAEGAETGFKGFVHLKHYQFLLKTVKQMKPAADVFDPEGKSDGKQA